jgi:hypothetical protein
MRDGPAEWWRLWVTELHRPVTSEATRQWLALLHDRYGADAVGFGGRRVPYDEAAALIAPTVRVDIDIPAPTDACASWPRNRLVPDCIGSCACPPSSTPSPPG